MQTRIVAALGLNGTANAAALADAPIDQIEGNEEFRAGQKQGRTRRITVFPVDFHRFRYPAYLARTIGQVITPGQQHLLSNR
ncbi:MAG: hypothetical protein LBP80_03735 [Treponema sp.]|jgi:hypothetical protein|nr:hypothetical protein [Treponema sp.]